MDKKLITVKITYQDPNIDYRKVGSWWKEITVQQNMKYSVFSVYTLSEDSIYMDMWGIYDDYKRNYGVIKYQVVIFHV